MTKKMLLSAVLGALIVGSGCHRNTREKAEDKAEQAGDKVEDAAEKAADKTGDAVEKAGDKIEDATDK